MHLDYWGFKEPPFGNAPNRNLFFRRPLDFQNIIHYILFRLKNAGATRGIFTKKAIYPLYGYTNGGKL
jgi:hypothetical protein